MNFHRIFAVLAGRDVPLDRLAKWAASADYLVAADGGADCLLDAGFTPHITLGDGDSASPEAKKKSETFLLMDDQDTTDCDKLLAWLSAEGHTEVTVAGLEGDLLDHVLGSVQSVARSNLSVRLLLRRGLGWIKKGPITFVHDAEPGARVSLIPITDCTGVSLSGVQWEFQGRAMSPVGFTSLSNRAVDLSVKMSIQSGTALLFLETDRSPFWP